MTIKMQDEIVSNKYNNKGGNSNFLSTYDNLSFLFYSCVLLAPTCVPRNLFMLYNIEGKNQK
jgi:hypothetical protein